MVRLFDEQKRKELDEYNKKLETLPKLPNIGTVLETPDGKPVTVQANDRGGFACLCYVPDLITRESDGKLVDPRWVLSSDVNITRGLRAIVSDKDVPKFKKDPNYKFTKSKVIGHAKNGRSIFISVD
jgi:hypothetical protein